MCLVIGVLAASAEELRGSLDAKMLSMPASHSSSLMAHLGLTGAQVATSLASGNVPTGWLLFNAHLSVSCDDSIVEQAAMPCTLLPPLFTFLPFYLILID